MTRCKCGAILTAEEIEFYGNSCNSCEALRNWNDDTPQKRARCWIFHDFGPYDEPREIVASDTKQIGQRRACRRCNAVDYRRILVHN